MCVHHTLVVYLSVSECICVSADMLTTEKTTLQCV